MYNLEQEDNNTYYDHTFTNDKVVEQVRGDLLSRSQAGINKYGVTLDRRDLTLKDWLQHAYEECLDQANYLKKCILEIELQDLQREAERKVKVKEDQGWEDFREGAYNAWKKKQEINNFHPKIEDGLY